MAYRNTRTPKAWQCRPKAEPFTAEEDAELCNMVRCGLDCVFWQAGLPHRPLGQMLHRRLQLIQAGELTRARPI